MESNSKIIKVVKTCYSGRIKFSPLSFIIHTCFWQVCVCTAITKSCTAMLDFECLNLHGDSLMHRNTVKRSACCAGVYMDGSRLSGYYENEINSACIPIQACMHVFLGSPEQKCGKHNFFLKFYMFA